MADILNKGIFYECNDGDSDHLWWGSEEYFSWNLQMMEEKEGKGLWLLKIPEGNKMQVTHKKENIWLNASLGR